MLSSSVTTKGQVTIPIELREKLGIKPGDRVGFVDEGGRIVLQRQESASAGNKLATFDRKLGKLPGARLIPR